MATFTFFDEFKRYLGEATTTPADVPELNTDSFLMYLSNTTPNVDTHTVKANMVAITQENNYTETALTTSWAETSAGSGIWRFANNADVSWTASGGSFGPFQYVVICNDSTTSPLDLLVGYWDVGSATTITNGNTFTVDLNATFDIFTLDG